ncbi:Rieske (2Fe-2S) protein [Nonomuraea ferruginea]
MPGIKGKVIAKTADVPVGGGTVVKKYKIVVTQPSEGVYKAYGASCPHRGCAVSTPRDNVMTCPCHGSEFDSRHRAGHEGPGHRKPGLVPGQGRGRRHRGRVNR